MMAFCMRAAAHSGDAHGMHLPGGIAPSALSEPRTWPASSGVARSFFVQMVPRTGLECAMRCRKLTIAAVTPTESVAWAQPLDQNERVAKHSTARQQHTCNTAQAGTVISGKVALASQKNTSAYSRHAHGTRHDIPSRSSPLSLPGLSIDSLAAHSNG